VGVGADAERVQVADGLGILVAAAQPGKLGGSPAVQASQRAQLVEGEPGQAQPLPACEQRLEALELRASRPGAPLALDRPLLPRARAPA
jgi:hypothetical protein